MIAVRVIIAEDAVYTGRLPIAAKCMSHHVVPTARDARVVEPVLLQDFLSCGPGKAAVTVPGEITIQQFIGLFEVNAAKLFQVSPSPAKNKCPLGSLMAMS